MNNKGVKQIKNYKKIISCIILFSLFISPLNVFAGTSASNGGGSGGGSGGSGVTAFKMGPSYSKGIKWSYNTGNVNWSSSLPLANLYVGNKFNALSDKWASVQKSTNSSGAYVNFRWGWWYSVYLQDPIHYIQNSYYKRIWQDGTNGLLIDPDLVSEAISNGFRYNSNKQLYENPNTKQKLDIVWSDTKPVSQITSGVSIVEANIDKKTSILNDISGRSARSLYNSPVTSLPYNVKTLANELNHKRTINATMINISENETYDIDKNGKITNYKVIYSKGSKYSIFKQINYDVVAPELSPQLFFKPFDLNRNGISIDSDVKNDYPNYNANTSLLMSVDNMQNIVNGSELKTLDTNSSLSFNIAFNNGQFGIPSKNQGGFDIADSAPGNLYKNSDGTYKNFVIEDVGDDGLAKTGELSSGTMPKQDIYGNISNESYWNMSAKAGISSINGSLTYGDMEKIGGENSSFSFVKGWNGGNFSFKTITIGNYHLSSNNRPWWEVQYEQGKFYGYGISYNGIIAVNFISEPIVNNKNLYARLGSNTMIQPILKGNIESKTVGGTIK